MARIYYDNFLGAYAVECRGAHIMLEAKTFEQATAAAKLIIKGAV